MPKDGLPVGARLESLEREVESLRRELRAATERGNAQRSSVVRTRRLEVVDDLEPPRAYDRGSLRVPALRRRAKLAP